MYSKLINGQKDSQNCWKHIPLFGPYWSKNRYTIKKNLHPYFLGKIKHQKLQFMNHARKNSNGNAISVLIKSSKMLFKPY